MKFPNPVPIEEIARKINARIIGDASSVATGINEIHKVEPGDITFSDLPKYFKKVLGSAATFIILNQETECPPGKVLLICDEPFEAYNQLIAEYRPFRPLRDTLDPSAEIHPTAIIEPGVIIGPNVKIGANTVVKANVVIREYTYIGQNVEIQSGTVIGSDAFYFKKNDDGSYKKWCSGGRVIIEDDVQIGASCSICRGVSGDTIIGKGTKIDCQVHIGHGAVVGKNCIIAGQVGIGGKAIIGDNVILYGQAGLAPRVKVGEGAVISAQSGVSKTIQGGKVYFGTPADEIRTKQRELAALRHLPDFFNVYYE
ncbi:MAG: UDP-3-O-(3-hydroxymyristoyl)glucosamine N-acyltransferase [Bacteroidetes bacterium]|nr:MAG: UDP-3-O-(3-hydroxymyristoyl)glucosamine N-acyltransferase [Bacteroidota bacterium]